MAADMNAGDKATQIYTDSGVVNIGNNLTATEVLEIGKGAARTVLMESWPFAEKLIDQRIEIVLESLIRKMQDKDESLLNRFRDPRFLAALVSVEKSFAETGDNELGEVLTGLLTDLASKEIRSRREIVLRQAVECAPRLTTRHLNALSVIFRIDKLRYPFAANATTLITELTNDLSPYFDAIPEDNFDYEYMGSTEAGTYLRMTTSNYLERVYYGHNNALYEPFDIMEFTKGLNQGPPIEDIQSRLNDVIGLLRTSPGGGSEKQLKLDWDASLRILNNDDQVINELKPGEKNLRAFLKNRSISFDSFSTLVQEQQPELAAFFDKLQRSRAFDFRLSPVGLMLARHEIASRSPEDAEIIDTLFDD